MEYAFAGGGDGSAPVSNLLELGGKLYGTTVFGGDDNLGEIYALDPGPAPRQSSIPSKVGSDGSLPIGGLISAGGLLYGTTGEGGDAFGDGTVYSLDPASGAEIVVSTFHGTDGAHPSTDLIMVGGLLYGVTGDGGLAKKCTGFGCGTIFSLDPATGVETVLHTFRGGADGESPTQN